MIDETRSLEAAEAQVNAFVERRAAKVKEDRAGQERQNALEAMWRAGEERHREKARRQNRALWYAHHERQRELFAGLAAEHDRKARELLDNERMGA